MMQKSAATRKPDDPCPHKTCDGSGRIMDEDGFETKCLCLIEKEGDEQHEQSRLDDIQENTNSMEEKMDEILEKR